MKVRPVLACGGMRVGIQALLLLNFSHPLNEAQLSQVASLSGQAVDEIRGEMPQFDHEEPMAGQVAALADRVGLSPEEWQTVPILTILPGFAPAAATMLAELHGRMGHFPAVLRLKPEAGSVPTRYVVAEIVDLQAVRSAARGRR